MDTTENVSRPNSNTYELKLRFQVNVRISQSVFKMLHLVVGRFRIPNLNNSLLNAYFFRNFTNMLLDAYFNVMLIMGY